MTVRIFEDIIYFEDYTLFVPKGFRYESFSEQWFYGVVFWNGNDRYEVIHNYHLGNRLLINIGVKGNLSDRWADIPFNIHTMGMIPNIGAIKT